MTHEVGRCNALKCRFIFIQTIHGLDIPVTKRISARLKGCKDATNRSHSEIQVAHRSRNEASYLKFLHGKKNISKRQNRREKVPFCREFA